MRQGGNQDGEYFVIPGLTRNPVHYRHALGPGFRRDDEYFVISGLTRNPEPEP